jgi:hypothetical protein
MNNAPADTTGSAAPPGTPGLVQIDPWLAPHTEAIRDRQRRVNETLKSFGPSGG